MNDEKKTFMIATTLDGQVRRPPPFEESFEAFGHTWVTHRRIFGIGYAMSHRDTGYKIPGTDRERAIESKVIGLGILEKKQDQIDAILKALVK